MGKTSPTTGTGKKAQKAVYKAQKYAAEEFVKENERKKPLKKSSEQDLKKIAEGKTGLTANPKKLLDIYRSVEKDAGKIFSKHRETALDSFNQYNVPETVNQFGRETGSGSSALNQALAASKNTLNRQLASDFSTIQSGLAQNLMGQSQNAGLANLNARLQANSGIMGNPMQPITGIQPSYNQPKGGTAGMGGTLLAGGLSAAGSFAGSEAGAAAIASLFASSREVKENIKDYDKGLEVVRELEVKNYDYTISTEGRQTNRVGLIAEDIPEELQGMIGDIRAVDVYGLVSLLVNCVKQLDEKVKILEAA